jgi:hypothetical protein
MIRNLKTLGLAAMAVMAFGAVMAASASAQVQGVITSDNGQAKTLRGTEIAEGQNKLTAFGLTTTCAHEVAGKKTEYTGHEVGSLVNGVPNGATEATITPHYRGCTTLGFPTTVNMNGCDYIFKIGTTTGGVAHTYGVTATVKCPVGQHIHVEVFTNSTHTPANRFCTIVATEKTGANDLYTGLHATDQTNGHIRIHGTVEGLTLDKTTGDTDSAPLLCTNQTTEAGKLDVDVTVEAPGFASGNTKIKISEK